MRKIESKKKAEKRSKRNQLIIGGILIFIMIGSTFGYVMLGDSSDKNSGTEKVNYKGYLFVNTNGFWVLSIGNYNFIFQYNPEQVEKVDKELNKLDSYAGKVLYFFYENENVLGAATEISQNLRDIVLRVQGACIEEEGCPEEWPIKDCSNNFIIIKEANESKIYQEENCVFIEGQSEELIKTVDGFLFNIMGI